MEMSPSPHSSSDSERCDSSTAGLSIYQIARRNCRERLLVQPLHWTKRHLDLLQCSFEEPSQAELPVWRSDFTGDRNGAKHIKRLLYYFIKYSHRENDMAGVLADSDCPFDSRKNLRLYLNRAVVKTLTCKCFFLRSDFDPKTRITGPAMVALIDRQHIEQLRRDTLPGQSDHRWNQPLHDLFNIRWKKLSPAQPLHDPYICALLIAMAQQRRIWLRRSRREEAASMTQFSSQVLCTSKDKEHMHLYTADIPSVLLDMFDFPAVSPSERPSVSIQITTIPYKPGTSLRNRLFP
ncbi:hypothetical protein PT974_00648 [Cladobotryum mycophilum]|uniref:Uncharacterized protein n=1 Tax=Cladobotryum mycophilum TaxID=491253 RepID=A0ABR0T1Q0_9HYPO